MQDPRALLGHPLVGPSFRYAIAGTFVGLLFLGAPLLLNTYLGIPIEAVIPVALISAIALHFNLQRRFVFRHVREFALRPRQQLKRYLAIVSFQYPAVAIATALLPGAFHISQRIAYVGTVLALSVTFFLLFRLRVFHPAG